MAAVPESVFFVVTLFFLGLPVYWAWRMAYGYVFKPVYPPLPEEQLPEVAVIFPLRGDDPSLRHCLAGLLAQDYPRFFSWSSLSIAPTIPPGRRFEEILAGQEMAHIQVRLLTLCPALPHLYPEDQRSASALSELSATVEVAAMIDADVSPPRDWLRTLAAPFADPSVGGVSGVRW